MFDMVTQHRKDDKMTFEDLVIAKVLLLFNPESNLILIFLCFKLLEIVVLNAKLLLLYRRLMRKELMMRLLSLFIRLWM